MNQYKACFFDIDGTIYSHGYEDIPASTKEALYALKAKGWKLGIATSRCASETNNLPSFYRNFPFDAYVYDGGAHAIADGKIIKDITIPREVMDKLIDLQKTHTMDLRYSAMQGNFAHQKISDWYLDVFFYLYLNMPITKAYEGEPVYNILVQSEEADFDKFMIEAGQGCHVTHYHRVWELTAPGVEKSVGIQAIVDAWGIDMKQTICFGDGQNDIEMIKSAGLGVAMGNGKEALKAVADEVCGHIDEEGLYYFFKNKEWI